jgi:uncharacterized protein YaeQ
MIVSEERVCGNIRSTNRPDFGMALTATIYTFEVELSDVDRSVYETLTFKAAQQPSETAEYLLTRVLAYCLEYAEGIGFSRGIAEPDEPAVAVRDLTGAVKTWIEIGAPDAARLHKASKAAPRVVIYTHRDPAHVIRQLEGERIHKRETIEVRAVDRGLLTALAERLDRRMNLALSHTEGHVYLTLADGDTIDGAIERHALSG